MPIPQSWTVWAPQLLSLLVGVLLVTFVLLPLTGTEARAHAPPRFAGAIALAPAGITDADLPPGWRVQQAAERAPWPSEGAARAVWSVAFSAADGRRRGAERLLSFPSSGQAERWLVQARERARARGAQPAPCHDHAAPGTSTTIRTTADGARIEQVLLRQRSLVLRLVFSYPAADLPRSPCTAEARAIVVHASQRTAAFLTQRRTARDGASCTPSRPPDATAATARSAAAHPPAKHAWWADVRPPASRRRARGAVGASPVGRPA